MLQAHRCCMALQQWTLHGVTVAGFVGCGVAWHGGAAARVARCWLALAQHFLVLACGVALQQVLQRTVLQGCRACVALQRDALGHSRRHGLNMC